MKAVVKDKYSLIWKFGHSTYAYNDRILKPPE